MSKNSNTGLLFGAAAIAAALIVFSKDESKPLPKTNTLKPSKTPVEFIINNLPFAIEANKKYPQIPIEIFLSFSGLESGFGKHAPRFNFFGTKPGKNYKGKVQLLKTTEFLPKGTGYNFPKVYEVKKLPSGKYHWKVDDYFRAYDSPLDAYLDFGHFITSGRYKKALGSIYSVPEIVEKIRKIWAAGYATDPNYVSKQQKMVILIKDVIKKYAK